MRAWMLGGMRVPLLLVVLLIASALAVPAPLGVREEGSWILSSDWLIEDIDYHAPWNGIGSLDLDAEGRPHIAYFFGDAQLRYARWNGSAWSMEVVDSGGYQGPYVSLALDADDNPHIGYSESGMLMYAEWTGGNWSVETVELISPSGHWVSLALQDTNPHMNHYDWYNEDLRHTWRVGGVWYAEIVDSIGEVGRLSSIAIDSRGYPHIGYLDGSNWALKYARWNGSTWTLETVDSAGTSDSSSIAIALDFDDYPHISYQGNPTGNLKYARWNGSAWNIETVDASQFSGRYSSMALDSTGHPHISYFQEVSLKYARWNGNAWEFEIPDPAYDVGGRTSIAIDENDDPHITYLDLYNRTLKYATKADPTPSRSLTLDIDPDTLNLKSKGRWITAYLSAENASVHDMDVSTILLQDALAPERWDYQDDVLMLKFNRQEFKNTVQVGESVQVKITGKWEDGTEFEAYDSIRVIEPGK